MMILHPHRLPNTSWRPPKLSKPRLPNTSRDPQTLEATAKHKPRTARVSNFVLVLTSLEQLESPKSGAKHNSIRPGPVGLKP
ncbi:hypothetical protein NL676_029574 [Syzygium grande]|nr:hypothetical protein NL676_029574 [Syzygium grande]